MLRRASKDMIFRKQRAPIEVESLETPLTEHCNLKCAACDHASPHLAEKALVVDSLAKDLSVLSRVMKAKEYRLVGGEPLLHPDLNAIINIVRDSGIAQEICLITNGLLLHRVEDAIWESIDKLWVSDYPGVRLTWSVEKIEAKCRKHGVVFEPHPVVQFRKVLLNHINDDGGLIQNIYNACKPAHVWKCYTLADGRFFKCAKPVLIRQRLAAAGNTYEEILPDGVDLHKGKRLRRRLEEYLSSTTPLGTCYYCLGSSGPVVDHHQLTRDELVREFIEDDADALAVARKSHDTPEPAREKKRVS